MRDTVKLLKKELFLAASPLSYIFLAFAAMALIPNYPPLVGGFFICLGIFRSFTNAREAGDIFFTALLPVAKRDAVRGKYLFTVAIELAGFLLFAALTPLRMALSGKPPYAENVLMAPNPAFLGYLLVLFSLFNTVFLLGFFKTAYKLGIPFAVFGVCAFVWIAIGETLHHLPGLAVLNASSGDLTVPWLVLLCGAVIYVAATYLSYRRSAAMFEIIDL